MNQGNQSQAQGEDSLDSLVVEESFDSDLIVEVDNPPPLDQSLLKPEEIPRFDIVESQERTRANLAYGLLALLVVTLAGVGAFVAFAPNEEKTENNRELLTLIWTSEVTLVSSALGFYFGSQTRPR